MQIDLRGGTAEEGRKTKKPWLQGIAISMTPEVWDFEQLGYAPAPGYGLDWYPLQLDVNRRRREGAPE